MTASELRAIRRRQKRATSRILAGGARAQVELRTDPECYPITLSALDVAPLLQYVALLEGLVHDLREESLACEVGRQEGRRQVLELLLDQHQHWGEAAQQAPGDSAELHYARGARDALAEAVAWVDCAGPRAPQLAPDDLRRENERLRQALERILDDTCPDYDGHPRLCRVRAEAIVAARVLLEESP